MNNLTLFVIKVINLHQKRFNMNTKIGNKIKSMRKLKMLSQEQVADYLHISQSTYARIENGDGNSWAIHIKELCDFFEIEPDKLLELDSVIINQNQQGGNSNNAYVINQLSEKLILQLEARISEKDLIISELRAKLNSSS